MKFRKILKTIPKKFETKSLATHKLIPKSEQPCAFSKVKKNIELLPWNWNLQLICGFVLCSTKETFSFVCLPMHNKTSYIIRSDNKSRSTFWNVNFDSFFCYVKLIFLNNQKLYENVHMDCGILTKSFYRIIPTTRISMEKLLFSNKDSEKNTQTRKSSYNGKLFPTQKFFFSTKIYLPFE